MIVTFSVSNFRSFSEEQTLSLVASKRLGADHTTHLVPIPHSEEHVLRSAIIYGANGSGKSNFFKALYFLYELALFPRKQDSKIPRDAFKLDDSGKGNSQFDLQFITGGKLYRYGLIFDDYDIQEEWLLEVRGNKEISLFERSLDKKRNVIIELGKEQSSEKLKALALIGGPPNQSFLSTVRSTLQAEDFGEDLSNAIRWFKDELDLISPTSKFPALSKLISEQSDFRDFASLFLRSASTGIQNLSVEEKSASENDLRSLLPESLADKLIKEANEDGVTSVNFNFGEKIIIKKSKEDGYFILTVKTDHLNRHGENITFDFKDESDGTRRLLELLPALHKLNNEGGVYVVDEIERSMHPILIYKFMQFFLESCADKQQQLIVTSHESNLMDLQLLRRDEIWFCEKTKSGETRLYSLADYKARRDLKIDKHYLEGRFGAIPFLGGIDKLLTPASPT